MTQPTVKQRDPSAEIRRPRLTPRFVSSTFVKQGHLRTTPFHTLLQVALKSHAYGRLDRFGGDRLLLRKAAAEDGPLLVHRRQAASGCLLVADQVSAEQVVARSRGCAIGRIRALARLHRGSMLLLSCYGCTARRGPKTLDAPRLQKPQAPCQCVCHDCSFGYPTTKALAVARCARCTRGGCRRLHRRGRRT